MDIEVSDTVDTRFSAVTVISSMPPLSLSSSSSSSSAALSINEENPNRLINTKLIRSFNFISPPKYKLNSLACAGFKRTANLD